MSTLLEYRVLRNPSGEYTYVDKTALIHQLVKYK